MASKKYILVVDDEPSVRLALGHALRRPEWDVQTAESAEEALEFFKRNPKDLLLVDKNFPGMNGTELVQKIRGMGSDAAVIMMTGFASSESALEMARYRIDAYIEKPFSNIFDVVGRVEAALKKRDRQRAEPAPRPTRSKELSQTDGGLKAAGDLFLKAGSLLPNQRKPASVKKKLAVLVIAPDRADREWITDALHKRGKVQCAAASKSAMEMATGEGMDIVICDLGVTDPDFFEIIVRLRALSKNTSFMAFGARPALSTVTRLIDVGVHAIVEKPLLEHVFAREFAKLIRV